MHNLFWYPGYDVPLDNIVRAENCTLYDASGNRYVDLESGVWCLPLGHSHPEVLETMQAQAGRIAHTGFSYSNAIVEEAARAVLDLHGFAGGKCNFLCSGSEAVEFSVRVAQTVNTRPLLMTLSDSYFGAYGAAHRRSADEWFAFDWFECDGCETAGDCTADCRRWAAIPFDKIGGFLFEPGSSSGLVRFPPEKLIRSIAAAIRAGGGLIIVNEVTTGIGRTGKWFGYQHYNLAPDAVALGKGIGNGYPVSAAAFSSGLVERLTGEPVMYAQSHQNDPLGAAIAGAVIRIIEAGQLIERGQGVAARLIGGLKTLQGRTGKIAALRARGLMAAVELHDAPSAAATARVQRDLVENGFVLAQRPGLNVLRIDPALTIEERDIENFLAVFEQVLA